MQKHIYQIKFSKYTLKSLKEIPKNDLYSILSKIKELAIDPFSMKNVKKLNSYDVRGKIVFENIDIKTEYCFNQFEIILNNNFYPLDSNLINVFRKFNKW